MNNPNKKILYRNGKAGTLLTIERPNTAYCMLTMMDKSGCIIHHDKFGNYLGNKEDHGLDVMNLEE